METSERAGGPGPIDDSMNWAGSHRYSAQRIHHPMSIDEARWLVAGTPRIRAFGARHTFTAIPDCEGGELLTLRDVPVDLVVDPRASQVTVGANATYSVVAAELERAGYALHNLASLPQITVFGACATGTHGSGDRNRTLATAVSALELILPDGSLHTVRRGEPDFDGMVVSLGYAGIVTRVTLDLQPSFQVRQRVYRGLPWSEVEPHFDDLSRQAYSMSFFLSWQGDAVEQVWMKTLASEPALPDQLFGSSVDAGDNRLAILEGDNMTPRDGTPGPWSERLAHFKVDGLAMAGNELQSEYFVARRDAIGALLAVRRLAEDIAPHLRVTEIRTVAGDGLWLSPMYERDSVGIHFTWLREPEAVRAILPKIEAALAPFQPRPHWGKVFTVDGASVRSRYPKLSRFLELVRRLDPDGKFQNDFFRGYLAG
ncbi:MAG: D-arabinono-1,4-lactone oxidase [Candidatus Dormiibacterota bacterium]